MENLNADIMRLISLLPCDNNKNNAVKHIESIIKNAHTLDCSEDKDITDISMFTNLHTLNCRETKVTDVSRLVNLHVLYCGKNVTDISKLVNLHTFNCNNIRVVGTIMNSTKNLNSCHMFFLFPLNQNPEI